MLHKINLLLKINFTHLLVFLLSMISGNTLAQSTRDTTMNSDDHEHGKNEIAIAISAPYFVNEQKVSYSLHVHYIYNIPKTKFGIGAAYEAILLDPKHNTFGLVASYRPIEELSIILSPGVTFESNDSTPFFSMHTEVSYGFEVGKLHIGPALEFAYDPNDYHISLGLHLGFGF